MFYPTTNQGMPYPDDAEQAERRAQLRRRCERTAVVRVDGRAIEAAVRNVSLRGIGMVLSRRLQPGTLMSVEMQAQKHPLTLEARVVHSTQQPKGWLTGCEFIDPLDEEDLVEWLG